MGRSIAYFDCFSGASGDMLLAALLDAGLELSVVQAGLSRIGIDASLIHCTKSAQHGITGTHFSVADSGSSQPARTLPQIREILSGSGLPADIVEPSLRIFTMIAEVEGTIHGLPPEEVHFHELSALDSLVDIVGFNLALQAWQVEAVFASPLPLGRGSVKTAHGILPLPAPAALALLARVGSPTIPSSAQAELVTPTGAAILAALAEFRQPAMTIQRVGYGLGTHEFEWANLVRVWIGEELNLAPARHHEAEPEDACGPHEHLHHHEHTHGENAHGHSHPPHQDGETRDHEPELCALSNLE